MRAKQIQFLQDGHLIICSQINRIHVLPRSTRRARVGGADVWVANPAAGAPALGAVLVDEGAGAALDGLKLHDAS